jgi:BirA family biotin operon repressor/biotin-[acetyl-CoA-carboxylase] ligase
MIGRKILRFETVDSTNNYTANLIQEGEIAHGTVILSDIQTNGRGQRGAKWHSNAGENMISSFYIEPFNLSVNDQVMLTYFVSLSITGMLFKFGLNPRIKWPNDILIGNKKIAGVLIENQLKGSKLFSAILGIGLNVNQLDFIDFNGTGIKAETGEFHPIEEVLFSLISEMNKYWALLENGSFEILKDSYLSQLWLKDEPAQFVDKEGEFTGVIRDIDSVGKLLIEKKGKIERYDLKELTFLQRNDP